MNRRMIKQECYLDMLEEAINSVESVLNYIDRIKDKVGVFSNDILQKDAIRAQFDLELALASLSILLRKMAENILLKLIVKQEEILIVLFILISLKLKMVK